MIDAVHWYDAHAIELAKSYESIEAERVHAWMADLLPTGPGIALDVGAGTGRDAAWLSQRGFDVVAAEPSRAMREQATRLRPDSSVTWVLDGLPDLREVLRMCQRRSNSDPLPGRIAEVNLTHPLTYSSSLWAGSVRPCVYPSTDSSLR